ncbi:TonB-dependent receptor (plasmid) [Sphingopyxis granuli]|nr:TonB-dependent receptor [Sphingopyxis granuli]
MGNRFTLLALLGGTALASPAFAEQAADSAQAASTPVKVSDAANADSAGAYGDIVVTAQKRSERLRDVPLSVTAASGDQLAVQGISAPADLERIVPGFTFQKSSYGIPVFTIRGIGLYDTFVGMSPTVTVYVDQVPLPYLAMTAGASVDIERVEALKGPQGTLFGQNSTGGAINYIAAKPTEDLKAGFDLTYGRFNQLDAQAFISGPISDTLRARFVVRHEYRDDWQYSETRLNDSLGKRDFTAARLLLDWTPSETLNFVLNANAWWDKSETQAAQFVEFSETVPGGYPEPRLALQNRVPARDDPRLADWDPGAALQRDDWMRQISLRGDWEIGSSATLTSITAYSDFKSLAPTDADGTDFNNFYLTIDARIKSFSQELRLAGDIGRIKYTVGVNYQDDKVDDVDRGHYTGTSAGAGPFRWNTFNNAASQRIKTKSIFGNFEYALTDTLTAQGAIRYTDQDRDFDGCLADGDDGDLAAGINFIGQLFNPASSLAPIGGCVTLDDVTRLRLDIVEQSLNENNTSWRAGLNWKPSSDLMLYGNVTRGYKSGSFTPIPAVLASQLEPVTQESVLAYEAGFKSSLFNNALQLSGAAFYYDYEDKQLLGIRVIPPFGNLPVLVNVPKSSVRGVELEATIRPIERFRLNAGVTYVDSRVDGTTIRANPYGQFVDLDGQGFPSTPKWQFVSDAQYDIPLSNSINGFIGGSVTGRSGTYALFGENPNFRIKGYALVDLRAGLESPDGSWRLQVWGRNIFDKFYSVNVSHITDTVARTAGMGATYGVTLSYRYK